MPPPTVRPSVFAPAPPRRQFKPLVILAAVVVVAALVPITFKYQAARLPPMRARAWKMGELDNCTEPQAIARFGRPVATKDYNLSEGSFVGPRIGPKRFVRVDDPAYAKRIAEPGTVSMQYPQFTTIREEVWKLADSYLTIWFFLPRAEADFNGDNADVRLPNSAPGVWAQLDNYRVGFDLVAPASQKAAPGAP